MNSLKSLSLLARHWIEAFIDPRSIQEIVTLPNYFAEWWHYNRLTGQKIISWLESYPCLNNRNNYTAFDPHYFYQASWAARKLAASKPVWHIDVGSSVMMIIVISAWTRTGFVDLWPLKVLFQTLCTNILCHGMLGY